ncbi:DNA adenine methylase [Musicola keenii]|uniref:DNA adenine methylase n=1 Tax=Musicola keenii TaxID=2884250 RepID=UPI001784E9DA|nr:DNA adenine methylase [Musicola keenii]
MNSEKVSKCSQYTFKYNKNQGRHGWLRLTPAYSVKLVEELILNTEKGKRILDPFSGTATTGLCSLEQGYDALLCDINPFLIWFGNTKLATFEQSFLDEAYQCAQEIISKSNDFLGEKNWTPDIHNINRWWNEDTLASLAALRSAMVHEIGEPNALNQYHSLIWIGFCRLIIETSSAAFNHVSMSFNIDTVHHDHQEVVGLFQMIIKSLFSATNTMTHCQARVIRCDAREIDQNGQNMLFDHVITSPPYPNRMSYIRELRPYMYWTKFLNESKEAAELDWKAIGGTWGSATSKLKDWAPSDISLPDILIDVCEDINNKDDKHANLMSRYVHKYFFDMHRHFSSLRNILSKGAKLDYVVGNSSFYGVKVDSDKLFEQSLRILGYDNVSSKIVRKRNSKKELYEFCVSAEWNRPELL